MARGRKKDYILIALRNIQNIANNKGYSEEETANAAAMSKRTFANRKSDPHTLKLDEVVAFANHENIPPASLLIDVYDTDFLTAAVSLQRKECVQ